MKQPLNICHGNAVNTLIDATKSAVGWSGPDQTTSGFCQTTASKIYVEKLTIAAGQNHGANYQNLSAIILVVTKR